MGEGWWRKKEKNIKIYKYIYRKLCIKYKNSKLDWFRDISEYDKNKIVRMEHNCYLIRYT